VKHYYTPLDIATGQAVYQLRIEQTTPGWRFCRNYQWQDTGFLDAPNFLPRGGTYGLECSSIVIGTAHDYRPGAYS
jgi:hypothetical protein